MSHGWPGTRHGWPGTRHGWPGTRPPRPVPQPIDRHALRGQQAHPEADGETGQGVFLLAAVAMLAITAATAALTRLLV